MLLQAIMKFRMKRFTKKNWLTVIISLIIGFSYLIYILKRHTGEINNLGILTIIIILGIVSSILFLLKKLN